MIHIEERGPVSVLRIEHGKVQALDLELLQDVKRAFGEFESSPSRAAVVTGTGSSFSAGVDLFRILDGGRAYIERFLPALDEMLLALFASKKPVVAAINGHAIAGGCIIACACDHRLMARGKGRIGVPELAVGVPFPSLPLAITRFATPVARLQELVFGAATYAADDALARGLIDAIVDPDALLARATDVASKLASMPATSFELVKRDLRAPVLERWKQTHAKHDGEVLEAWCAAETHAAIRRYLDQTIGKSR